MIRDFKLKCILTNNKSQGKVATRLSGGEIYFTTLIYCWVYGKISLKVGQYMAKLGARRLLWRLRYDSLIYLESRIDNVKLIFTRLLARR